MSGAHKEEHTTKVVSTQPKSLFYSCRRYFLERLLLSIAEKFQLVCLLLVLYPLRLILNFQASDRLKIARHVQLPWHARFIKVVNCALLLLFYRIGKVQANSLKKLRAYVQDT